MSKPSKRSRWQSYVDDALLKTGQVTQAAIHGLDGKRWASSSGLQVNVSQDSSQGYSIIMLRQTRCSVAIGEILTCSWTVRL